MPKRPDARRIDAVNNPNYRGIGGNPSVEIGKFVMGYGLFPSAFVLNFVCIREIMDRHKERLQTACQESKVCSRKILKKRRIKR